MTAPTQKERKKNKTFITFGGNTEWDEIYWGETFLCARWQKTRGEIQRKERERERAGKKNQAGPK